VNADYIVVGSGSAGSTVTHRLGADAATQVVALEAGPRYHDKFIHIPAAFSKLLRSEPTEAIARSRRRSSTAANILASRQGRRRHVVGERNDVGSRLRHRLLPVR
jgi:choline dehydrogenase-like flavoprotein